MKDIDSWLKTLLEERFGLIDSQNNDSSISILEARDCLCIYAEVLKKYHVKIKVEDILDDCFLSFDKLSACIQRECTS